MTKLNFANAIGTLSRSEMKNIMAGSGGGCMSGVPCRNISDCGNGSGCNVCKWGRCDP